MKGKATQIRAGFLLATFLCYLTGIISMTHICIVEGQIITHAHRMTQEEKSDPTAAHHGDKAALLQLQQFSDIATIGTPLVQVAIVPPYFEEELVQPECAPFYTHYELHELALRAPPVLYLV